MVGRTSHGAHTVVTSGQTTSDRRRESTLAVTSVIDALEESELGRVWRRGGVGRVAHVLDGDVGMSDDIATRAELLGRGIVRAVGVGEGTQLHVGDLDSHVEVLVGCGLLASDGAGDDSRDHVSRGGHLTHHDTVTRALLLLQAVGQSLARAKVDEVGTVGLRFGLAGFRTLGSVLRRAGLDGVRVQSQCGVVCSS